MSCYFTRIFEHLPVNIAACYFSVHSLIVWDPENIYLFEFNNRNNSKRYEICQKLTINTIESRSDVFTVKCFYCWLWIGKCLSRSSFLSKYYYLKYWDEQMLYLTSFKQQNFSKAKFSKYLTVSSCSTYLHEKGFQPSSRIWNCRKLSANIFFSFPMPFFHQLILQEDIFRTAASLIFFTWFVIK